MLSLPIPNIEKEEKIKEQQNLVTQLTLSCQRLFEHLNLQTERLHHLKEFSLDIQQIILISLFKQIYHIAKKTDTECKLIAASYFLNFSQSQSLKLNLEDRVNKLKEKIKLEKD